jgi:hypothetical protein
MWEDTSDTLRAVSASKPLPVNFTNTTVAVTNAGTFVVQENGAALTSLQLIDDAIGADGSASGTKGVRLIAHDGSNDQRILSTDSGVLKVYLTDEVGSLDGGVVHPQGSTASDGAAGIPALGVRMDTPNTVPTGVTNGQYQFLPTDMVGGIRTALYETDFAVLGTTHVKKYYTNSGAVTDGIVWSPASGKRWYVTDIYIQVSAAATVTLEDDLVGGDSPVWKGELAANSGWSHSFTTPLFSGEDAADLIITTSAGNVYVTVTGYEI